MGKFKQCAARNLSQDESDLKHQNIFPSKEILSTGWLLKNGPPSDKLVQYAGSFSSPALSSKKSE